MEMEASLIFSASACLGKAIGTTREEEWQRDRSRSKLTLLEVSCCVSLAVGPSPLDFEASGFLGPVELAFCRVSYFLPCRMQEGAATSLPFPHPRRLILETLL